MAKHIVLEIDEGRISLTLAELRKRRVSILETREVPVQSMDGSALVFGINDVLKGLDKEGAQVHVALSDPHFLHFDLKLPKLDAKDQEVVMLREARRLGSFPEDEKVLIGSRRLEKLGKNGYRHAVVALPEKGLRPVISALAREGLSVDMVTSVEEAAVRLLPKGLPASTLFFDYGAGRVRFIYLERGVITQRRHILVPGLDESTMSQEDAFWAQQLSMEIGWNLDYLKEMGKPEPDRVVLSLNLRLSEEQRQSLAAGIPLQPEFDPGIDTEGRHLGQATLGLLQSLVDGVGLSILGKGQEERAASAFPGMAAAVSLALTLAGIGGAGWIHQLKGELESEIGSQIERSDQLRQRRSELISELQQIEEREQRVRLRGVLARRRPISRLLSEACEGVPRGITLGELQVQPGGEVLIRGQAKGVDRLASLELVKGLRESLQELPYLEEIHERVEKIQGDGDSLTFRVQGRWRQDR